MRKLKFPAIKGSLPTSKSLSMDAYLRFINLNLIHAIDRKTLRKRPRDTNKPFLLR